VPQASVDGGVDPAAGAGGDHAVGQADAEAVALEPGIDQPLAVGHEMQCRLVAEEPDDHVDYAAARRPQGLLAELAPEQLAAANRNLALLEGYIWQNHAEHLLARPHASRLEDGRGGELGGEGVPERHGELRDLGDV
jgi:hypothetical protein